MANTTGPLFSSLAQDTATLLLLLLLGWQTTAQLMTANPVRVTLWVCKQMACAVKPAHFEQPHVRPYMPPQPLYVADGL